MQTTETSSLLPRRGNYGLTVFFSMICIVDVFGVFPVIALPKSIIDCDIYGILVVGTVCSLQMYTAILLGKCWIFAEEMYPNMARKNRYPYSALAEITYGKKMGNFVTILLDLTVFGGGIPNLIVASQNLQLLGLRISENNFDVSFCYWIIILGIVLCPVLWLGSPKDMKVLCTISVVIVASVFILTCSCLIFTRDTSTQNENINSDLSRPLWQNLLMAYGIITFQFDIHPTILTIQVDMQEKSKIPLAVVGGFVASLTMCALTTGISFFKYGKAIAPSILETLPTSIPLHIAALLVAIQLCLTSAVSNSALYQHLEDFLCISREFNHKRCILRTILTLMSIVIAESVPRFDLVMSLIGGTFTGSLVFILPPLFYIKMLHLHRNYQERLAMESFTNIIMSREERSRDVSQFIEKKFKEEFKSNQSLNYCMLRCVCNKKFEVMFCIVIILVSFSAMCFSTYVNVNNAALSYSNFSTPCIYNITSALLYL